MVLGQPVWPQQLTENDFSLLLVNFWGEQGEIKKKCTPDVARYFCLTYIPEYFLVNSYRGVGGNLYVYPCHHQKIKGRHTGLPLQQIKSIRSSTLNTISFTWENIHEYQPET
jgi:hypothetical protein